MSKPEAQVDALSNVQDQAVQVSTADAEKPKFDINATEDISEMPVGQFDQRGVASASIEAKGSEAPAEAPKVKIDGPLRLSEEQRARIEKHSPNLLRLINAAREEENEALAGVAEFDGSPLREGRDLFGKNSIPDAISQFTERTIQRLYAKLIDLDFNDPASLRWLDTVNSAFQATATNESFGLDALNRPGSVWKQSLQTANGHRIHGRTFDYKSVGNSKLTGANAVAYAAGVSGAGRPTTFPMMSSGWTAMMRAATNAEWAYYYDTLNEKRAELGRSTIGVGFGASRALYVGSALSFALDHMTGASFKTTQIGEDRSSILRYLSVFDIDAYLTAFLVACHPDGFPVRLPCSNPQTCNHVMELDANLRTMMVWDESIFTEAEKAHMARTRPGEVDFESMIAYQEGLRTNQSRIVKIRHSAHIDEDISIEFAPCSAQEYIESSERYIEAVRASMRDLVSEKTSPQKRAEIQNRHFNAAPMREYAHLVKAIHIGEAVLEANPDNKENPRYDIEDYLVRASESEVMRTQFREAAIKFQQDALTGMLVVPEYKCPACGHGNAHSENQRFLNCTPVDVPKVFFRRALLRLSELMN